MISLDTWIFPIYQLVKLSLYLFTNKLPNCVGSIYFVIIFGMYNPNNQLICLLISKLQTLKFEAPTY